MNRSIFASALVVATVALAQTTPLAVPKKHIPTSVILELRSLEHQFDVALGRDCAPEKCVSKGCLYLDHVVVDQPNGTSLPGVQQDEGVGAVPAQEYLTRARCEFAYEKAVPTRDVDMLVKRLETRLSRGFLQVQIAKQQLEPISPSLSESPPPKPEKVAPAAEAVAPKPAEPVKWEAEVAARELWLALLPHFAWMIAVLLVTFAIVVLIWAGRRVGRESAEEKALLASLTQQPAGTSDAEQKGDEATAAEVAATADAREAEAAFAAAQKQRWSERVAHAVEGKDDELAQGVLREWLKAKELPLLAKATLVFGDRLSHAFPSDGELAERKIELANYLKAVDEAKLPSDADFFRTLNHHAIAASLLAQSDAASYRSLSEEFGAVGLSQLIQQLPPRHGALLFGLASMGTQAELARLLAPAVRVGVANELLASNRISADDREALFAALGSARAGQPLSRPVAHRNGEVVDRGQEFDAGRALSVLLPHIDADDRKALFERALERAGAAYPLWYEGIIYPDMLMRLPDEARADTLLEVDVRGLAGWLSMQPPAWRDGFVSKLKPTLQAAIRANQSFSSRDTQARLAEQGHHELVAAVRRQLARNTTTFSELIA